MDIIHLIAIDESININNVVNIVVENVGHALPGDIIRRRNRRTRNENYFEITTPRYTDLQFVEHFRMSRGTFQVCT